MTSPSPRGRFEAALLSRAPAAELQAGLAAGWLHELLPELRREMDVAQRTRWHHLSVLEHALATVERTPPVLEERLAALLHDIGKRRTASINPKTGDEQYLDHAAVGARLAAPLLVRLGYPRATVERVCRLIERHMDLHHAANDPGSPRAMRRLQARLGSDLPALLRLAAADTAAMHPALREAKLAALATYAERLRETPASVATGDGRVPRQGS
jgi:putative nucleotidyltransferase with HDIG domain